MTTFVGKENITGICPRCLNILKTALVFRYKSDDYVRYVYLCHHCEYVLKIINEDKNEISSIVKNHL